MWGAPKIYRRRPKVRAVLKIIGIILIALIVTAVVLYNALKEHAVYNEDGTVTFEYSEQQTLA
ncbi:MAG: hypothetical protein LBD85_05020 [Oscillospiraceae bacterium]|jgi:hypothetical protein|nr:hypothetical protein [Oscillospiraceae bacterium]